MISSILFFNQEEVLNVIKILRGNNDTADNCTHVSSDLVEYFKTGIYPNKESITKSSTIEDFDVVTMSDWIKKENGDQYLGLVKSIVRLNNTKITDIPYNKIPSRLTDGFLDLETEYIHDLDNYTQFTSSVIKINEDLKIKALENEQGISFGFICIGRCGKYINKAGHMLVYFATNKIVWYVDCQLYNGKDKIDNGCIFNDLSLKYEFANKYKIHIDVFGEYVFYIPIGQKIIVNMEIVPVKLETIDNNLSTNNLSTNIEIKQKQYKYNRKNREINNICEHDKRKSICKKCGGGSLCVHDHIKSSCKKCKGSQICDHNRQRSTCKECKGGSICEHDRVRSTCKECKGGSICEHDRQRSQCKECKSRSICEHDRVRSKCKDCKGGSICEHNRMRYRCKNCKGDSICEHNCRRAQCKKCNLKKRNSDDDSILISPKKQKIY